MKFTKIGDKKPLIMFPVKITGCNFEHTCTQDTESHRVAIQKCGRTVPDHILPALETVIDAVKNDPDISVDQLCPIAERFLPSYCFANTQFMDNLKRRVENYIIRYGLKAELSEKEARTILKSSRYSAAE